MSRHHNRRWFLREFGKGAFGIVVLGGAACGDAEEVSITLPEGFVEPARDEPTTTTGPDRLGVVRVDLGSVSAYVAVAGSEVVIVDTGTAGSEGQIQAGLAEVGLGWSDVGGVVLTHLHPDHIGSLGAVAAAATEADIFAGAADLAVIDSPRPAVAVGQDDTVATMRVIDVPGHTPGSIALHDVAARILIAGDAINGAGGGELDGPNPRYSTDHAQAVESARRLTELDVDTVYMGHGAPVVGGAVDALARLATEL